MSRFKKYLEMITTANFPAANHVGTIRKIKRLKNGKFEYQYAEPPMQMTTKNPDGSVQKQKKIKGLNEVQDYEDGIFVGGNRECSDDVRKSIKDELIEKIQKRKVIK